MTIAEARQQFPYLETGRIYLNHAATSPWSLYMSRKVDSFREGRMLGAIDTYQSTMQCVADTRSRVASMIGSEPECISFIQNTTEGLNVAAAGLDWKPGDRVILFEQEFPANVYPFLNLKRHGVEIHFVPQRNGVYDFNEIESAITPRTRLVAISWVQFLSGYRVDLGALSTLCRSHGVLLSVDGIQGVGAIRMNLRETPVDFVSAGVQKWQMGPQGLAVIHVSHEMRDRIHQAHLGWMSTEVPFNFFPYDETNLADSSRRYETGTYNSIGIHAYSGALRLFEEVGLDVVEQRVLENARYAMKRVRENGYNLITPEDESIHAGIVTFEHPHSDEACAWLEERKMSISSRCGSLRISPHFYNTVEEIDTVLDALREFDRG